MHLTRVQILIHPTSYLITAFEVLSCTTMIIGILWWNYKTSKVVELVDKSKASCTDYAIMVRNLPPGTTKEAIINFFSTTYALDKVSCSKDCSAFMFSKNFLHKSNNDLLWCIYVC